jgi:hypothetical protein
VNEIEKKSNVIVFRSKQKKYNPPIISEYSDDIFPISKLLAAIDQAKEKDKK